MVGDSESTLRSGFAHSAGLACTRGDATKLPFLEPAYRSAAAESGLPPGVIAEWPDDDAPAVSLPSPGKLVVERTPAFRSVVGLHSTPLRQAHVRAYPLDDEALLSDPKSKSLHQLNATAYAVWRGCEGKSVEQLAHDLAARFDVEPRTAAAHVTEMVELFVDGGLLLLEKTDAVLV